MIPLNIIFPVAALCPMSMAIYSLPRYYTPSAIVVLLLLTLRLILALIHVPHKGLNQYARRPSEDPSSRGSKKDNIWSDDDVRYERELIDVSDVDLQKGAESPSTLLSMKFVSQD